MGDFKMYRNFMSGASEKAVVVANKCLEKGYQMSAIKLEQLLILIQGAMLSLHQRPYFEGNILALEHALIIKEVDRDFLLNEFKEKMQVYVATLQIEEEIIDYIVEKYGNLDFFELKNTKTLNFLRETFSKEGEQSIVPNEAIEKVFTYYNFYELDCVKKQEDSFQKKLERMYK